jgi:hypothetical protein
MNLLSAIDKENYMPSIRQLAAIMLALRSFSEVGPAHSSLYEGGFTDIVGDTKLMESEKTLHLKC